MTTPDIRWWTLVVAMVTVVRVEAGLQRGLVVDVNTCTCTVSNEVCTITEINDQHYPWESSSSYPYAPQDLKVEMKNRPDNTPTMVITWLPPTGASLRALNGFYLELNLPASSFQMLQVSVPSNPTKEMKWNLTCTTMAAIYGKHLSVRMFSLPLPVNKSGVHLQGTTFRVNIPLTVKMTEDNAYYWMPVVSITRGGDSLTVEFPFPEQLKDKIRAFKIEFEPHHTALQREVEPNNGRIHSEFTIPESHRSTCFTIIIKKLCLGCRKKWLCLKSDSKCNSPDRIKANGSLTGTCSVAMTTRHPIMEHAMTIPPALSNKTQFQNPAHAPNMEDPEKPTMWWVPVMVTLVVITAVIMIICTALYCRTLHHRNIGVIDEKQEIKLGGPDNKKMVFIVYSDVLREHVKAVLKLAAYLQAECNCEVIIDEWYKQEMIKDIIAWPLKYYEKADKIIFIHSEDTKSKYGGYLAGYLALEDQPQPLCTRKPQGDIFSRMMHKTVMDINSCSDKYLMVRFPYTPIECLDYVQGYHCYALPNHLDEFVLHLHGLTTSNYIRGINSDEYHQTDPGRELQEAIQRATEVVRRNPNWLQDAYNEHAARAEADLAAATLVGSQCDDNMSTGSNPLDALGFLPPSSSENIPSLVGNPGVQHYKGTSPSETSEYVSGEKDFPWQPEVECNGFYFPTSNNYISVPMSNIPVSSYKDSSPVVAGLQPTVDYPDHLPAPPPHWLQNIGINPHDHIDNGFYSNEEATLMQIRQCMFQNPAGPPGALYRPQGEDTGRGPDEYSLYPPESLPSSPSGSSNELVI